MGKKISLMNILERYTVLIFWFLVIVLYSILLPNSFPTWLNVTSILGSKAIVVIISCAALIPLLAGEFDMSIAANMVFCSMIVAVLNVNYNINIWICCIIALSMGTLIGIINGLLSAYLNLDTFVITLGLQTLLSGITNLLSMTTVAGVDDALKDVVFFGRIAGISLVFFYTVIILLISHYVVEHTAAGRKLIIVGTNANVAELSGISVKRVKFVSLTMAGTLSGLAGIFYTGLTGSADASSGLSYLMPALTAVFLGSTCFKYGRANVPGVFVATYFLVTGISGLAMLGVKTSVQNVLYGLALVVAMIFAKIIRISKKKRELVETRKLSRVETD